MDADILVLQDVDYDHGLVTLSALRDVIATAGTPYPHIFAHPPNRGRDSGLDLDGDGRLGEPEDAHSYGWFSGEGGQAILSRYPLRHDAIRTFDAFLWADMPAPLWPSDPIPGQDVLRLSRTGHWVIPIDTGQGLLTLMTFHATAPVFDGPDDRNGRRNHDEILFWKHFLDGAFGPVPDGSFVIAGNANLDPADSDGRKDAIQALLSDPRLQDPEPMRPAPVIETPDHQGDPSLDTVAWPEPDPGHLRVSYVLPSTDILVSGAGVFWPTDQTSIDMVAQASRHRVVWVDVLLPK